MTDSVLDAWIDGRLVGTLEVSTGGEVFQFRYDRVWADDGRAFPISPTLPLGSSVPARLEAHSATVRRFFENLLPEGKALDIAAALLKVSRQNVFGLLGGLGRESTGALQLLPRGVKPEQLTSRPRRVSMAELSDRVRARAEIPFSVWDGRLRLSIAGLQDKLAVYEDADSPDAYFLVEWPLASTHLLKPESTDGRIRHLVANEHFCLELSRRMGLLTAEAEVIRVPEPILKVKRFNRRSIKGGVQRIHIIDACQALDLPVGAKYERSFGNGRDVAHIREGVSVARLMGLAPAFRVPAESKQRILRWVLFQLLIGNGDAHGKNLSFFVEPSGLSVGPAYDLVSTTVYPSLDSTLAMAVGDEFDATKLAAADFVELGNACELTPSFLGRELRRATKGVREVLPSLLASNMYRPQERRLLQAIGRYALGMATRLDRIAARLR